MGLGQRVEASALEVAKVVPDDDPVWTACLVLRGSGSVEKTPVTREDKGRARANEDQA